MELISYFGAIIIGLVLGLTGGGGSILAVPFLFYIVEIESMSLATSYSLFIIGVTSAIGSIKHLINKNIEIKKGSVFAIPAMISVFATRKFILPNLPDPIVKTSNLSISLDIALLILFAIIMILAAISMIKGRKNKTETTKTKDPSYMALIVQGLIVGVITGLVGAGGGFLIVPALVILAGIPMKRAVATSLFIIFINSTIGFLGDLSNIKTDWNFLLLFSVVSIFGILIGSYLNKYVNDQQLKKGFGYFVLIMGVFIISKELIGF